MTLPLAASMHQVTILFSANLLSLFRVGSWTKAPPEARGIIYCGHIQFLKWR